MDYEYGEYRGYLGPVEYYIPLEQLTRNKMFLIRNFHKIKRYFNVIKFCYSLKKSDENNILICFSQKKSFILFSYLLNKMFFDLSFIYLVEYPLMGRKKLKKHSLLFFKKVYSVFFDGQLFISEGLRKYFQSNKRNIIIPSMVLYDRFKGSFRSPYPFEYIGYCGTIMRSKDGVDILISGFARIAEKFPLLNLVLIGDFHDHIEEISIIDLVNQLNILDRVIFTGKISKNEMPAYLANAKILALTRPDNLQAETGFPTKLPEYLATGKPVVVTRVGDIPKYLQDGENAFIVEPNNTDGVAKAFYKILSNYSNAMSIAARGQMLAKTVFSPRYQARRVIDFISEIKEMK